VLVLPEGALPLGQPLPRPATAEVLGGGFRQEGASLRSSVLRYGVGARFASGAVDKHRLVPLGEWVPLARLVRWSGLSAVGGLEPGDPSRVLPRPGGAIGVAICYELADGTALARASRDGARWLLASANLDPYPQALQAQFTALARLRAIETGRWLVSVANTGPSLVVDASGQVRASLPVGIPAIETVTVRQRQSLTAYDRWGIGPLLLGWLLALLMRFWPWPPDPKIASVER
jgi:apolipoprotein N-acyltransferase